MIRLDLKHTAKKLYKTGWFSNFTLSADVLHFEYCEWQFNCYAQGMITATLPTSYQSMELTFSSDYQTMGLISKTHWLEHNKEVTDNPHFCKTFALSYVLSFS